MGNEQKPFFNKLRDYFSPATSSAGETEEQRRKRLENEARLKSSEDERKKVSESFKKVF